MLDNDLRSIHENLKERIERLYRSWSGELEKEKLRISKRELKVKGESPDFGVIGSL